MLRTNPDLAEDLLSLAHMDEREIIEDADTAIKRFEAITLAFGSWSTTSPKASRGSWTPTTMQTCVSHPGRMSSLNSRTQVALPDHPTCQPQWSVDRGRPI